MDLRQRILRMASMDIPVKQIMERLMVSEHTVKETLKQARKASMIKKKKRRLDG